MDTAIPSKQKIRAEAFRKKRESAGQRQLQVWLDEALMTQLDAIVKAGRYKNRSEIVAMAVSGLLKENTV